MATVCEEAGCPNRFECFSQKRATFLILGTVCTRRCAFCRVAKGEAAPVSPHEPPRIAAAVRELGLRYVVITSVTRDDLADGGAAQFQRVIFALKALPQPPFVEALIPDFQGRREGLETVVRAGAEVINHNVETVPRLYASIRPQADYDRSLNILETLKSLAVTTKSGIMVGLGEKEKEVIGVLRDLRSVNCDMVTIGQYLAPSRRHYPVKKYITPAIFEKYSAIARNLGFRSVSSGPFVRSSYHAELDFLKRSPSLND